MEIAVVAAILMAAAVCCGHEATSYEAGSQRGAAAGGAREPPASARQEASRAATTPTAPAARTEGVRSAPPEAPLVIFLGDSLTAGYGIEEDRAFPALIGPLLAERGTPVRVVNAGVSGDTTAGGLARLDWLLAQKPDVLVVGLGGNDGLRALPLESTERNLREIVRRARGSGAEVLLLGMLIPPSYGPEYVEGFAGIFPRVARDEDVPLVPFLLEGVGGVAELNQPDGIHPTAAGHERVARNVLPFLREILGKLAARRAR